MVINMHTQRLLFFAVFQAAWFGTAWMAGTKWVALAWIPMALWSSIIIYLSEHRQLELQTMVAVAALGWCNDSLLIQVGAISLGYPVSPPWLVAIWAGFAPTLGWGYTRLQKQRWLLALLGATFGYLSYRAGAAFGALQMSPDIALPWVAGCWAVAFPSCVWIRVLLERSHSQRCS